MVEHTNRAKGPRIIYTKGPDETPVARTLAPGETADVELFKAVDKDPVVKAWVDAGELVIGSGAAADSSNDQGGGSQDNGGDQGGQQAPDFDAMGEDELRAYLKARGITPDGRVGRAKLIEAAKAAPVEPTA
jgi:hypothetical protein